MTRAVLTPGGLHDRAEALVRRTLAADPHDTGVLWKLGEIHRRQGNLAAAHDVYRRLSAHGPDRHKASWLSVVLGGGGVPEAVAPRGVWPAPFVWMTDFLAPGECDRLYFFHPEPRRFSGGDLLLYDADAETNACPFKAFSRIVPLRNSIVFFPSRALHQVAPVTCDTDDFESGRFVVNGHVRVRGGGAPVGRPTERRGDDPAAKESA